MPATGRRAPWSWTSSRRNSRPGFLQQDALGEESLRPRVTPRWNRRQPQLPFAYEALAFAGGRRHEQATSARRAGTPRRWRAAGNPPSVGADVQLVDENGGLATDCGKLSCFIFFRRDRGGSCPRKRKAVLVQCVMTVRKLPDHTRSSCRKERNSTADHDWPCVTFSLEFGAPPAYHPTRGSAHRSSLRPDRGPVFPSGPCVG